MGGPQSRCGRGGEEKNSQLPPGIKPPNNPLADDYTLFYGNSNANYDLESCFYNIRESD
jgi:hypothetical protein